MSTTNYRSTFIAVAPDCPLDHAVEPPARTRPSVAALTFELLHAAPYTLTSDDVLLAVHAARTGVPDDALEAARTAYFATPRACLRSSDLPRRYGWGLHHDERGRVALHALGSAGYDALAAGRTPDGGPVTVLAAMRSRRA